jgi:hypothetical protein
MNNVLSYIAYEFLPDRLKKTSKIPLIAHAHNYVLKIYMVCIWLRYRGTKVYVYDMEPKVPFL